MRRYLTILPAFAILFSGSLAFAGSLKGTVTLKGKGARKTIKMSADKKCAALYKEKFKFRKVAKNKKNGGLANVFVYVKTGLEGKKFKVPKTAKPISSSSIRKGDREPTDWN